MRIIAATQNAHKLVEIRTITDQFGFELLSQADAGLKDIDIEETGTTFEENSFIKADAICKMTGEAAIADDSGIAVDYLGGAPGVYSARYAGEHGNDALNRKKLFEALEGVPFEKRTARFVSVVTLVYPDGKKIQARGEVEGHIGFEERGTNGFGYDCMFIPLEQGGMTDEVSGKEGAAVSSAANPENGRTFAEFSPEEKNAISHRGRALMKLKDLLALRTC